MGSNAAWISMGEDFTRMSIATGNYPGHEVIENNGPSVDVMLHEAEIITNVILGYLTKGKSGYIEFGSELAVSTTFCGIKIYTSDNEKGQIQTKIVLIASTGAAVIAPLIVRRLGFNPTSKDSESKINLKQAA